MYNTITNTGTYTVTDIRKTFEGFNADFRMIAARTGKKSISEVDAFVNDIMIWAETKYLSYVDIALLDSKEDRELSPWREFCEELITPRILPWKPFRYIDYKFRGVVKSPILNMDSGGKGMFLFEIYDLVVNDEQRPVLEELVRNGNKEQYIWVDDYLIQRLGHDERTKEQVFEIAPHTKSAQNLKWVDKQK